MSGALPSGDDPDFFDLGIWGILGAGLSSLLGRDQDSVTDSLKSSEIQGSGAWGGASSFLFTGLNSALGFPIAFLKSIVESLLGLVVGADNIDDLLDLITGFTAGIPIIGDLVEAITGILGGDLTDLTSFFTEIPIIGDLVEAITGVLGGDMGDLGSFFTSFLGLLGGGGSDGGFASLTGILSFFTDIPIIGDIVEAITGLLGGDLGDLGDFFTSFLGILGGGGSTGGFGSLTGILSFFTGIPIIGDIVEAITGLLGGDLTDLGDFFTSFFNILGGGSGTGGFSGLTGILGFFTDFTDVLTGGLGGGFLTGNIADGVVGGIGNILDNIFGAITGLLGFTGHSHTDMTEAVGEQAGTVASNSAQLVQVLAALGPGTPDADDFERTGATLGALWTTYTSGSGGTLGTSNGHDASWGGGADMEWVAKKNNKTALGDNQIVSMVFATSPKANAVVLATDFGKNDLWIRMNTFATYATRTGVRVRYDLSGKTLRLSSYNSGTETLMTQITGVSVPVAGTTMSIEAGTGGNPRRFVIKLNGVSLIDWVESGTSSLYGTAYRYRGFGGRQENILFTSAPPGSLKQWTAQG